MFIIRVFLSYMKLGDLEKHRAWESNPGFGAPQNDLYPVFISYQQADQQEKTV